MDHRGPDFGTLGKKVLEGMKPIFKCSGPVYIFPASGTGAWEAAMINVLSPGDRVLMFETGHFASLWRRLALKIGFKPEFIESDWRSGADAELLEARLKEDKSHEIKAVCVVHNETSTGAVTNIANVRKAMDVTGHPALLMVDTISSLASIDFRQDDWGVDVTVAGSQKGLMLPPGLSFNAVSKKALKAAETSTSLKSYWSWSEMSGPNNTGYFPYTPATNLLYGLSEALDMLEEEGLENVFVRHKRHSEATRLAVKTWGLEILCKNADEYSDSLTAIMMPEGHSADNYRRIVLERFNMSLGSGLGKVADKIFRIGHLGDFNDLTLLGTLAGVEMGLIAADVPHTPNGVKSAMDFLAK